MSKRAEGRTALTIAASLNRDGVSSPLIYCKKTHGWRAWLENSKQLRKPEGRDNRLSSLLCLPDGGVTFHTYAKVVRIMRQNACALAFCVQNLL